MDNLFVVSGSLSILVKEIEQVSRILFTCFITFSCFNLLRLGPLTKLCKMTSFSVSFLSFNFWLFLNTFSHPGFGCDPLEAPSSCFNTCRTITISIKFKKIFLLIFAIALFTSTLVQRSQGSLVWSLVCIKFIFASISIFNG
jgi:hypothetical protein